MGSSGYLPQVICEVTPHFGSKTIGVLRIGGPVTKRVKEAIAGTELSSAQTLLHQIAYGLAFHARACGLEFGHYVLHYRAHIFQRG
ncbi:MAG: hypothetical protein JWM83_2173 [Candidatus Angelobacter sp.]|nr:hypothetical protein [Candidatus Angelobacter sp.]